MGRALYFLFFLFSTLYAQPPIEIVYHVATLNCWERVVQEQLEALERSGLGDACDRLTMTVVGPDIAKVDQLLTRFSFYSKTRLIHAHPDVRVCEFPGIEAAKQIALEKGDANILYMHSKGITHLQNARAKNVRSWRRYLEYFLIDEWQKCQEALQSANLCGAEWLNCTKTIARQMETPGFFAGNFWWARADYLQTCRDAPPRPWNPEQLYRDRYFCEVFIATGNNPIPKSFHQSGVNLYEINYTPEYYMPETSRNAIEIVYLASSDQLNCVKKQLQLMQECGLAEACDRVTLVAFGSKMQELEALIKSSSLSAKTRLIHANDPVYLGEFSALEVIKRIARANPLAKICYFHNLEEEYPKAPPPRYKS